MAKMRTHNRNQTSLDLSQAGMSTEAAKAVAGALQSAKMKNGLQSVCVCGVGKEWMGKRE